MLPPREPGLDAWIALGHVNDSANATIRYAICTSHDLAAWSSTPVSAEIGPAAQTRFGAIVVGDACIGIAVTCDPDPRAWLSTDGVRWTPLSHPPVPWNRSLADGPAGVLLIGSGVADAGATTVWRLVP